jgi:Tfp pilus assembly protein PilN
MAQQINLYRPNLLAPRRHFSAAAMARALAALALGLVLLAGWTSMSTQRLRLELAAASAADERERQHLNALLAQRPAAPADSAALEQELAQAQKTLAERRRVLDEWNAGGSSGAARHSAFLQALARTVPAPLWLTEVRLLPGRFELTGAMLQPELLRPWLERLAGEPAAAGQALRSIRVERREPAADGTEGGWTFHVLSSRTPGDEP